MTGFIGALREAWDELRVHRTRVLLSLIGVAISIAALTAVLAFAGMLEQGNREAQERSGGRPATLSANVYPTGSMPVDNDAISAAYADALERYDITWSSNRMDLTARYQFSDGTADVQSTAVDPDFGTMHRITPIEGRWFTDRDELALAPRIVVNEVFWERLGSPPLDTNPTVSLRGNGETTAVIVGVVANEGSWQAEQGYLTAYMLYADVQRVIDPQVLIGIVPSLEMWVPEQNATALQNRLQTDLAAAVPGTDVQVYRSDYKAFETIDPLVLVRLIFGGVAVLVLLLGALSLFNISMVTLRQRIREIGVRRSFGATEGRIFFGVMLESVVGTAVAGAVGVLFAVILLRNPLAIGIFANMGVTDPPPFPLDAAIWGIVAAVLVGALAGLGPALVAVRIKVIDAIRF